MKKFTALRRAPTDLNYPQYARLGPEKDIETLWQRPPGETKGMLFVAHGCNHQAPDLFSKKGRDGWMFDGCQQSISGDCLGLPEEVEMRRAARERGYLVVAVSGGTGVQSCWDMAKDANRVKLALQHIREKENLGSLPLFATGASSGGHFMGALASVGVPYLKCIVPQISGINVAANFPKDVSTLFVHMPRDRNTASRVQQNIQQLQSRGARASQQLVHKSPLSDKFLENSGLGLTPKAADDTMRALSKGKIIDGHGFLVEDPRMSAWRDAVKVVPESELGGTKPDESPLSELLNVAYAQHEFTADYSTEMLNFCEGHA